MLLQRSRDGIKRSDVAVYVRKQTDTHHSNGIAGLDSIVDHVAAGDFLERGNMAGSVQRIGSSVRRQTGPSRRHELASRSRWRRRSCTAAVQTVNTVAELGWTQSPWRARLGHCFHQMCQEQ